MIVVPNRRARSMTFRQASSNARSDLETSESGSLRLVIECVLTKEMDAHPMNEVQQVAYQMLRPILDRQPVDLGQLGDDVLGRFSQEPLAYTTIWIFQIDDPCIGIEQIPHYHSPLLGKVPCDGRSKRSFAKAPAVC